MFAPCALGGILERRHDPEAALLRRRGRGEQSAPGRGARLRSARRAGILYAPDYVVNAGGIVNVAAEPPGGYDEAAVLERIQRIPEALREIFATASERRLTPLEAAQRVAEDALADGAPPRI